MRSIALVLLLLGAVGCAYRPVAAPQLDEAVAIRIASQAGMLPSSQLHLQAALARSLRDRLGWRIHPSGRAALSLKIGREHLEVTRTGVLGTPESWNLSLTGSWTLTTSQHRAISGPIDGSTAIDDRPGEDQALAAAADTIARSITDAIEHAAESWTAP